MGAPDECHCGPCALPGYSGPCSARVPFAEQTPLLDGDPREARLQEAALEVHHRFGRNALVKGRNLCKEAMTITRHGQIGGHHA